MNSAVLGMDAPLAVGPEKPLPARGPWKKSPRPSLERLSGIGQTEELRVFSPAGEPPGVVISGRSRVTHV